MFYINFTLLAFFLLWFISRRLVFLALCLSFFYFFYWHLKIFIRVFLQKKYMAGRLLFFFQFMDIQSEVTQIAKDILTLFLSSMYRKMHYIYLMAKMIISKFKISNLAIVDEVFNFSRQILILRKMISNLYFKYI